jgi:adenine phosphoribosyltransferase
MDLKKYIRSVKDYPKKGILFRDITTLIKNSEAFNYSIDQIVKISKMVEFDKISAIESRGFIFASAVSYITKKPLILLRKKNKLPADRHSIDFQLEYGDATIEVHKDSIDKNEKILVIDDLIATGGTAEAAAKLIEISGGKVAGFIFIINLFDLPGNDLLKKKSYFTKSLIEFPGH